MEGGGDHSRSSAAFTGYWAGLNLDWECLLEDIHLRHQDGRSCLFMEEEQTPVEVVEIRDPWQHWSGVVTLSAGWTGIWSPVHRSAHLIRIGINLLKGEGQVFRIQELKCISKIQISRSRNSTHLGIQGRRLEAELMNVSVKWSFNLISHSWELRVVLSLLISDDFRVAWWSWKSWGQSQY